MMKYKTDRKKQPLPILVDLSEKNVILLSDRGSDGNEVLRTARFLLSGAGHLTLLTPCPSEALKELAKDPDVTLTVREYLREDLFGADAAVCALTSPALRDDVYAACRTLGIRLCILNEEGRSDFHLKLPPAGALSFS